MGILTGKKGLILGVANDKSIAWGIAQAAHREGATLGFNFPNEALGKRVRPLAESVNAEIVQPMDVQEESQMDNRIEASIKMIEGFCTVGVERTMSAFNNK